MNDVISYRVPMTAVVVRRPSGLRAAIEVNPGKGFVYSAASGAWTSTVRPLGGAVVRRGPTHLGVSFSEALALLAEYRREARRPR